MYTSKHYTCEEIDQRLLQGYYDDAVKAGFNGTIGEFWGLVLSIYDKVDKKDGYDLSQNDFTNELKAKLDSIEEGAKAVTKVSQLENDLKYQTQEDVEDAINNIIAGAPEALDTLKELAEALADNPNFATDITNQLTALRGQLTDEVARAKAEEIALGTKIDNAEARSIAADQALETKLDSAKSELESDIENVSANVTANTQAIAALRQKQTEDNAAARQLANDLVAAERERAQGAEQTNAQAISTLNNTHIVDKAALESADATEASERRAKDQELENAINTEVLNRTNTDTALQTAINKEIQDRKDADTALQTSLESKIDTAKTSLESRLQQEINDRTNEETTIKNDLATEVSQRSTSDQILQHSIEDLDGKIDATKENLNGAIATEAAAREAADQALDSNKVDKVAGYGLSKNDFTDELKQKLDGIEAGANKATKTSDLTNDSGFVTSAEVEAAIQAIVDAAPAALDTLKEIADALGDDPNFAATITNRITAITQQLNSEITNRENADNLITTKLDNEIQNRKDNDDVIKGKVEAEVTNRTAADTVLQNQITSNKQDQNTVNERLQNAIDALETAVNNSNSDLHALITENTGNIQRNLQLIQNQAQLWDTFRTNILAAVQGEIQDRKDADAELLQKINDAIAEYTQLINDLDTNLTAALEAEKTAREQADTTLQGNIDTVSNDLATEVSRAKAAEQVLTENLATETTNRETGDRQNKEAIEAEVTRAKAAEKANADAIAQEVTDRTQADTDEATARANADTALGNRIEGVVTDLATEVSNRTQADTTLQSNIELEATAREEGDGELQNQIDELKTKVDDIEILKVADVDTMSEEVFGTLFDPDDPENLVVMNESEVSELYQEVYD